MAPRHFRDRQSSVTSYRIANPTPVRVRPSWISRSSCISEDIHELSHILMSGSARGQARTQTVFPTICTSSGSPWASRSPLMYRIAMPTRGTKGKVAGSPAVTPLWHVSPSVVLETHWRAGSVAVQIHLRRVVVAPLLLSSAGVARIELARPGFGGPPVTMTLTPRSDRTCRTALQHRPDAGGSPNPRLSILEAC